MKKKLLVTAFITILFLSFAAYPQSNKDLVKKLDEYMNRVTSLGFSGALLVAKEGRVIFANGYGLADRQNGIPVTPETIFTIGSITKQFTAAAILKLEMQGKLSVHDRITKYFKKVPADKAGISLHHLLTHSAGFPPALGFDFAKINRDEYIELALKTPLNHKPGEIYEYSNVGFSLLAAIVEQVSGHSYDDYLQENLFKPAGMLNTGYPRPDWNQKKLAHGYRGDEDWGTFLEHPMAEDGPYWHLRGNGGIHSTIFDMFKWHQALEGNEILSAEAKKKYYTPYIKEGPTAESYYGYGWSIVNTQHGKLITHNGGNPYFTADFLRYMDANVVIYIVSNSAEQRATRLSRTIARIVFGENYALPPREIIKISPEELSKTEIGRHAMAFLQMLASENESTTRGLIEEHFASRQLNKRSIEKQMQALKPDQEEIGDTEIGQVVKSGEHALELTVQSKKTGQWWLISLEFDSEPPHGIAGIGIMDTMPPVAGTKKKSDTAGNKSMPGAGKWKLPDSPTGRRSSAFLEVIQRADDDFTKQFIQHQFAAAFRNKFTMEEHLQTFHRMYNDLADIELLGAQKIGPYSAELGIRSKKTGKRFQIYIELTSRAPHLISSLNVEIQ